MFGDRSKLSLFYDSSDRSLAERKITQKERLAELKEKIRIGIEDLDRGEGIDGKEVFAELEEDSRRIEAEMA